MMRTSHAAAKTGIEPWALQAAPPVVTNRSVSSDLHLRSTVIIAGERMVDGLCSPPAAIRTQFFFCFGGWATVTVDDPTGCGQ